VGQGHPLDFEKFSKKGCFLDFECEKTNFTTFGPTLEKFWKNPLVLPPPGKILPTPMPISIPHSSEECSSILPKDSV